MSSASQETTWVGRAADDLGTHPLRTVAVAALVVLVHVVVYAFLQYRAEHVMTLPAPAASQPLTIEFAQPAPKPQVNPVAIPAPTPPAPQPKPAPPKPTLKPQPRKMAESKPTATPLPKPVTAPPPSAASPASAPPASASSSENSPVSPTPSTSTSDSQAPLTPAAPGKFAAQNPQPNYPMQARRRKLEGDVVLSVQVDAQGLPQDVRVQRSSGHDMLDNAAVDAVKRWRFEPARRGGQSQSSLKTLPLKFRLNL